MPDITMCVNTRCLMRTSCYRYMAVPSQYRQSFSKFESRLGDCEFHMAIGAREIIEDESNSLGAKIERKSGENGLPKDKEDSK